MKNDSNIHTAVLTTRAAVLSVELFTHLYLRKFKDYILADASGFEPLLTEPKTVVLPLHHAPMYFQWESNPHVRMDTAF